MSIKSKKGRNPTVVDNWLDSLGFYRKNVAYDETCLFRAVSEQLFECQIYHERVRKDCIEYGKTNFYDFLYLLDSIDDWFDHLDLLEKHMVICGNIEMQLISYKYEHDIIVFDAVHQKIINITNRNLNKKLTLCLMNEDHYDVVHPVQHIQNTGFCQSIVYNILYENVFEIPNVQDIVRGMLYDKEFVAQSFVEVNNNELGVKSETSEEGAIYNIAPFPFKIAKALDPTIYRNIEYDSWTEIRRELRLGDWYYGDDNLILGTRCILNADERTYECYIQDIIKDQNKCVVYVTKLAQKRTVNYTDLSPENDAKPWPLPYRFTKNLVVTTNQNSSAEKILKLPKKRKDKRRIKSSSDSQNLISNDSSEQDVEAFIGVPLQHMQDSPPTVSISQADPTPETPLSQHNLLITPEIASPLPKFSWDTAWNTSNPESVEKSAWSQAGATSPTASNYTMKPMVASAPVTPNVVPYHDTQYPFIYNYHVDNYQTYNGWAQNVDYTAPSPQHSLEQDEKSKLECCDEPSQVYNETYEAPVVKEIPTLSLPQANPQPVEVFSPIIPVMPGTPVIYTQPSEVPDMIMPGPPFQVYTPPVDVQYLSPTTYFYSPTISTTWYPMGINSQGFIFPTPVNQNLQSN